MARWNKSDKARIEERRAQVERLKARGLGVYEITRELSETVGIVNPNTGEPYDASTISRDLSEIEKRWREATQKERQEWKAEQLAELRAARRAAWEIENYSEVRRNLEAEMRLLGTDEPQKVEHSGGVSVSYINDWREHK